MIEMFGLLHLEEGERSVPNLRARDFNDQITVYVDSAVCLSKSLRQRGINFTLLTNQSELVQARLKGSAQELHIREIPCRLEIPEGIKFYSAHFKFDAIKYLAALDLPYAVLCDLDMVCNQEVPGALENIAANKTAVFYDISDQVIPVFGREVIIRDLQLLHGLRSEGRWAGGEFIGGTPEFFGCLHAEVQALFARYLSVASSLHHVGDETLTSAALEVLRSKGTYIADAGTLDLVGRYWSIGTLHVQRPFSAYESTFLLHLPSDKRFLASMAVKGPGTTAQFLRRYRIYRMFTPRTLALRLTTRIRNAAVGA